MLTIEKITTAMHGSSGPPSFIVLKRSKIYLSIYLSIYLFIYLSSVTDAEHGSLIQ